MSTIPADRVRAMSGRTMCAGSGVRIDDPCVPTAVCQSCGKRLRVTAAGRMVDHPNPDDVPAFLAHAGQVALELALGLANHAEVDDEVDLLSARAHELAVDIADCGERRTAAAAFRDRPRIVEAACACGLLIQRSERVCAWCESEAADAARWARSIR